MEGGRTTGRSVAVGLLLLAAALLPSLAAGTDVTTTVVNVAPVIASVGLSSSSVVPTAGSTTGVTATITVTDANGFNDITGVTLQVLKPDGTTSHIAASAATLTGGSLVTATYTKTFAMDYHDPPATGSTTYKVKVVATDTASATGDNAATLATFNYAALAALGLGSSSLNLGSSFSPGDTSPAAPLTVQNHGNVRIDLQLSGTALAHGSLGATIPVGSVRYSGASDMSGSSALGTAPATLGTFDLATGAGSSRSVYLQVAVPAGTAQWIPSGTYGGTLTVAAVAG